jgi:predicted transcriptional regulator
MPFGDTAKKVQRVTNLAEELYEKTNQVVAQLQDVRERLESTTEKVDSMERELETQRAIIEALAEQQGVDVESVVAEHTESAEEADDGESADQGGESAEEATPDEGTVQSSSEESGDS